MGVTAPAGRTLGTGRLVGWATLVLLLAALNYAGNLAGDEDGADDFVYRWSSAVAALVQFGIMLALVLWIAGGAAAARRVLGLRRPTSWRLALGLGFALLVAVYVVLGALSPLLQPGEEQGLVPDDWDSSRVAPFVANAAIIVLAAPVVEELLYRGLGVSLLVRYGRWVAVAVIGLAFAAGHGLVEAIPVFVVFGAGLAYLRLRTDSVYPPLAVHSVFNGIALAGALAT
jgi:membrane protease YdiL (CAAX protease family)